MNKNDNGNNLNSNNRKRRLNEFIPKNKKPRITQDESTKYSSQDKKSSLYYQPTPKSQGSPREKSNSYNHSTTRRYLANERLKSLRRNIDSTIPNSEHSVRPSSNSAFKSPTSKIMNYSSSVLAKPSNLEERIRAIRHTFTSEPPAQGGHKYFTTSQDANLNSSTESLNVFTNNNFVEVNNSDDFMDWSYIEEKEVLSKINKIRNQEIITRVTPSTMFQERVSKELMDIPNNDSILKDIYIVVDTNIFISHLDVIRQVLEIKVNGVASPIVLIPWIVIQELDYLKDYRTESKLKKKSQSAIRFINERLSFKDPQVKGQSVRDAAQQNFSSKNADDSILHCCLQVVEKQNRAMLLSNDINLRSKALIHGISTYSHTEITKALDPYRSVHGNFDNSKGKDIELCFKNLFSFIILMQLKEAYGTALNNMHPDLRNPPWTLLKCLNLFQRFWQPIFSMFLQKQFIHKVEQYLEFLNKNWDVETMRPMELKMLVEFGLAICVYLKNALPLYQDSISECISSVENIVETLSLPDVFISV